MKRHFLALTILFLSITAGHGQTNVYRPFPDTNAFWGIDGGNIFNTWLSFDTRFGINGDTLINEKTYKKIYSLFDSTITSPQSIYYACIREENKKIYAIIGTLPEYVLYDFSLTVGDTISYYYSLITSQTDTFSRVVTSIDSILLANGQYRKQYHLDCCSMNCGNPDTWVEGIGSIVWMGLFNPLYSEICLCGDWFSMTCAKQNDTILYLNNSQCNRCFCTFLTNINEGEKSKKLIIFPNPFTYQTTLQIDCNFKNANLALFNSFGQLVRQITEISGQTITLKRDDLPSGIYFLRFTQDNIITLTEKLVITEEGFTDK